MPRFALTIFLSAFLLFQVQPLIGKVILPWFGGTVSVWTTCLVFFQIVLLGGYVYAHRLQKHVRSSRQGWVHGILLLLSAVVLAGSQVVQPGRTLHSWSTGWPPALRILLILSVLVGLPYFVLSTTSPLLQSWIGRLYPNRSPYRLYALSNLGSMLALLSYPVLLEPRLRLHTQGLWWSAGYVLFVVLCMGCIARLHGAKAEAVIESPRPGKPSGDTRIHSSVRVRWRRIFLWLVLAGTGSLMLLATTNHVCRDVASVPLLWVVPLALYLLSLIICFDHDRWYNRRFWGPLLVISLAGAVFALEKGVRLGLFSQIGIYLGTLFVCCMVCHGELVRSKQSTEHLTLFYVVVAAGGALGSVFVAFVAPALFRGYWEYPAGLVLTAMLAVGCFYRFRPSGTKNRLAHLGLGVGVTACGVLACVLVFQSYREHGERIHSWRNFYGVKYLRAVNLVGSPGKMGFLELMHDTTAHGRQFLDEKRRYWPTAYFGRDSGIGLTLRNFVRSDGTRPNGLRVGVLGLGAGTLAVHAGPYDTYRFYEIDPQVIMLAEDHFTFIRYARQVTGGKVSVVEGDARIRLEEELSRGEANAFDVLVMDAFSSDSVPTHLLTKEAFDLYRGHLREDGVIAINISNRHSDFKPLVKEMARASDMQAWFVQMPPDFWRYWGTSRNQWVLMTRNEQFLRQPCIQDSTPLNLEEIESRSMAWSDDYSCIWPLLKKSAVVSTWDKSPRQGYWVVDETDAMDAGTLFKIQQCFRRLYLSTGERFVLCLLVIDPGQHPSYFEDASRLRPEAIQAGIMSQYFKRPKRFEAEPGLPGLEGYAVLVFPSARRVVLMSINIHHRLGKDAALEEAKRLKPVIDLLEKELWGPGAQSASKHVRSRLFYKMAEVLDEKIRTGRKPAVPGRRSYGSYGLFPE